jgi:hypothetical protein
VRPSFKLLIDLRGLTFFFSSRVTLIVCGC